jgi:vacuolar protein sorting-associated protein 33A
MIQRKDPTAIFLAAQALMPIQQRYGLFPRIIGKGNNGRRLMELLFRMRSEAAAEESSVVTSKLGMMPSASIESLIIIDREIDFATLLLTPLTYEGLIDELFGIRDNQSEIDSSIVGPQPGAATSSKSPAPTQQQSLKRKIQLDSSDKLYDQVRDTNIAISGRLLNKVARRLESDYESRHAAKSTSEIRDFVNKLPGFQSEQQSLKIHTGIAGEIKKHTDSEIFTRTLEVQQNLAEGTDPSSQHDTMEELVSRDVPLTTILRLLCLESCVSGGLRPKDLDQFKRLILQAYGYQHLLTFDALEKMHLLYPRSGSNVLLIPNPIGGGTADGTRTNYAYLRKALRLIVEEVNEQDPNDIAYVYSGYAPLSVRLVQCILQKQYLFSLTKGASASNGISSAAHGWQGFEDVLKNVKGETFNRVQRGEEQAVKTRHMIAGTGGRKTVVVMFLGGITFTEIAALRFVAKQEEGRRRILICTTDIIGGNGVMDAAIEKGDFGKG